MDHTNRELSCGITRIITNPQKEKTRPFRLFDKAISYSVFRLFFPPVSFGLIAVSCCNYLSPRLFATTPRVHPAVTGLRGIYVAMVTEALSAPVYYD